MENVMKKALEALGRRRHTHADLREALPALLQLYAAMLDELTAPHATIEDLCVVIRYVGGSHGQDAAERLLTEPKLVLDEATLVLILLWVPVHREAAAMQLILDRSLSRDALAKIVEYTNEHAHEAATRLMAMEPTDSELGLILARVPMLTDEACQRLGAFGPLGKPGSA